MTDTNKLRAIIKDRGLTHAYLAKMLGITKTEFSRKMNGRSGFTQGQISVLVKALGLCDKETIEIFLSLGVT